MGKSFFENVNGKTLRGNKESVNNVKLRVNHIMISERIFSGIRGMSHEVREIGMYRKVNPRIQGRRSGKIH